MHNYYFKIKVNGRGAFPLDQLRRYEMFPIDPDSGSAIGYSLNPEAFNDRFDVTLGMYASSLSADTACIERFRSFGWTGETLEIWKEDELFMQNGEMIGTDAEYVSA